MGEPVIFGRTQQAIQTPFDNSTNGFTATEVQSAIEEVGDGLVIKNVDCDSTVFVNAAVRMSGGGTAFNALATALSTSNVIGVVQKKATSILCDIRVIGTTPGTHSGLDVTKEYFLSHTSEGVLTTVAPTGSGAVVVRIGQPFSATQFLVNKGTPLERA